VPRFHTVRPDTSKARLRFPVRVQQAPYISILTWSFPEVRANGATLAMQWGATRVAMDVEVVSTIKATLAAAEAAPYVGRYRFVRPGSTKPRDFIVTFAHDTLKGEWDRVDVGDGEQKELVEKMGRFVLLKIGNDWFAPALLDDHGQIYEVMRPEMVFQFARADGQVNSFEVRDAKDNVVATGTRKN